MWDRIQRLHEHHGDVPLEIRILKITEEVGEVAEAFIGVRGQTAAGVYAGPARISWMNRRRHHHSGGGHERGSGQQRQRSRSTP